MPKFKRNYEVLRAKPTVDADKLYRHLVANPPFVTAWDLHRLFHGNRTKDQLMAIKQILLDKKLAVEMQVKDNGQRKTVLVSTQLLADSQAIESQIVSASKVVSRQTLPRPAKRQERQLGAARERYGVENSRGSAARKNSAARNKERKG